MSLRSTMLPLTVCLPVLLGLKSGAIEKGLHYNHSHQVEALPDCCSRIDGIWIYEKQRRAMQQPVKVFKSLERLSITFTSNSKREFVPRDQVSPLLFIISTHKLGSFAQFFIHKNWFELFLSAHFLFCEILTLNLTFAVCRIREA